MKKNNFVRFPSGHCFMDMAGELVDLGYTWEHEELQKSWSEINPTFMRKMKLRINRECQKI
jgi:hypothetical protein